MRNSSRSFFLGIAVAALAIGCSSSKRVFRIASYPTGATVFVNDERRGVTDVDRLALDFPDPTSMVTVRIVKEGYQSTGAVLSRYSPPLISFFLQEAPDNAKITEVLANLQRTLAQIAAQLERNSSERP